MHNEDPQTMASDHGEQPDAAMQATDAAADARAEHEALKSRIAQLEAGKAELEASNAALRDTVLREKAELENQRRRLQRDLEQARKFANERLLNDLLPVYDGLESGLSAAGGDIASMREGLSLTLKSLLKVAESNGMVQVDPLGQPLDPDRHHAVSMVEAPGKAPGIVVNVLQKGYLLNDRLLRPALVAVAKD